VSWLVALGLVSLTAFAFAGVRTNGFVESWDDGKYLVHNPNVAQGLSWDRVFWAFTSAYASNWHPLTWLSHMLDVQWFGMDAGVHHLVSLAIHVANTLLLFRLFAATTRATWRSAFVAALFAVHPLHVESVAWASERKDVLSTLFLFLTLLAYVAWTRRRTAVRYAAVVACFAAGLASKPMLVTVPFLLLLLDAWPLARLTSTSRLADRLKEKIPLFALSVVSCVVTLAAQRGGGAVMDAAQAPIDRRIANAPAAYVAYVTKTLWPTRLAAYYPSMREATFTEWAWAALCCAALVAATWAAVRVARARPYVAFGWFWLLGMLVPVIGLVQVGGQAMADRYSYVSCIGLFVIAAWGGASSSAAVASRGSPRSAPRLLPWPSVSH